VRLTEDDGRVTVHGDARAALAGAAAAGLTALLVGATAIAGGAARDIAARSAFFLLVALAVGLAVAGARARRMRFVFDPARREITQVRPGAAPRAIPFDALRGVRLVPIGRGFQLRLELVTTTGESIELGQTGVVGEAKTVAAHLSTRFGLAALAE
jgi:hypothetical protein